MELPRRKAVLVAGRVTQVEICACAGGLVVTIGAVSLRLDVAAAGDLAATLAQALHVAERTANARAAHQAAIDEGGRN